MAAIWAGIDAGKTHHHCVAIDESGRRRLSRRVANDEPDLLEIRQWREPSARHALRGPRLRPRQVP
ncbi:IS110 family transposase, partial [Streptomyces sp.]|uniref:IS110 family transposase n=1 Tax=Streptomyces sp. TaxID=1931 RepID=UPI002F940A74